MKKFTIGIFLTLLTAVGLAQANPAPTTTTRFGEVKPDGTSITVAAGVISAAVGSPMNVTEYTPGSYTYNIPAGAKYLHIKGWAAGGAGGGGRRGAAASVRVGGGGGGAGGYFDYWLDVTTMLQRKSAWSVTVGAGGTIVTNTTDNSDGSTGGSGGNTQFDSLIYAAGGGGGVGGAGGFGGTGGGGGGGPTQNGTAGANASTTGGGGNDVADQTVAQSLGGGAGGGITSGDVVNGYGHGGPLWFFSVPRDAYTAGFFTSEGNPGKTLPGLLFGGGANGGSGNKLANAVSGGAGAPFGGGGGGAGGTLNGFSNASGAGGDGHMQITAIF